MSRPATKPRCWTQPSPPAPSSTLAAGLTCAPRRPIDTSGPETFRRALEPIAARHGATFPQVTLAWLLARSPAIMPIPTTPSIEHLQENLDAQGLELSR